MTESKRTVGRGHPDWKKYVDASPLQVFLIDEQNRTMVIIRQNNGFDPQRRRFWKLQPQGFAPIQPQTYLFVQPLMPDDKV